jgi:hypothetical protein
MMASNPKNSPYNPDNSMVYSQWRERKLASYPATSADLLVPLADLAEPVPDEYSDMFDRLARFNMVIYAGPPSDGDDADAAKHILTALFSGFGLKRIDSNLGADDDSISALSVTEGANRRYIPYTDRPISWHTDGYYNPPDRRIRGMALHCVQAAGDGGDNRLMDPEIAYILLRDENPDYIAALMHPDAMLIPENDMGNGEIRAAQGGPVFSIDEGDGCLHMRYTARTRSIEWRDDDTTRAAVGFLSEILTDGSPYVFSHRMAAGEGILCNNVLHNRSAFMDDADNKRLVLRARSYDRCAFKELKK